MTESLEEGGLIEGAVARVDSNRSVVINRGRDEGVSVGQKYQIISREGEEILDPETNEVIDTIPFEKARVQVEEVFSHTAIAKTYGRHYTGASGIVGIGGGATLSELFGPRREVFDTFVAEVTDADRDMTVRVGDRVRQRQ